VYEFQRFKSIRKSSAGKTAFTIGRVAFVLSDDCLLRHQNPIKFYTGNGFVISVIFEGKILRALHEQNTVAGDRD
jgi:hypothetical protein